MGTISALEALRDALYKLAATSTTVLHWLVLRCRRVRWWPACRPSCPSPLRLWRASTRRARAAAAGWAAAAAALVWEAASLPLGRSAVHGNSTASRRSTCLTWVSPVWQASPVCVVRTTCTPVISATKCSASRVRWRVTSTSTPVRRRRRTLVTRRVVVPSVALGIRKGKTTVSILLEKCRCCLFSRSCASCSTDKVVFP